MATALVLTALASLVLVGALNLIGARNLLEAGNTELLTGVGEARAASIERGVEQVLDLVSVVAADLSVARAVEDLTAGYAELDDESLDAAQTDELREAYQERVVDVVEAAGLATVTVDEMLPSSTAGRYLQHHYGLGAAARGERDPAVADAGDGSRYSRLRAEHHPYLASLVETLPIGDILLVSADGADVVYSVQGRIDMGTDLRSGPFADTAMAAAVLDELPDVRVGEPVIADFERYLPGGGRPVLFAAAAVRSGTEIVGTLVVQIPVDALNAITTAGGEWADVGLEDGESYVVGPDLLLRSESRRWIEDPEGYLEEISGEDFEPLIETFDSPVAIQPVDTEPVQEALDGRTFSGRSTNYLGEQTFSYARPLDAAGLQWAVVVDVPLSEARAPLVAYLRRLGIVVLLIVPLVAVVGVLLADRLARRIPPVVRAARAVAAGDRDPDVGIAGNDELGDLARRLERMASQLGQREQELEAEYERRRSLLLTVLPERVVDDVGAVEGDGDLVDVGTVVAVSVAVDTDDASDDLDLGELRASSAALAESLAAEHVVERIRADADRYLFVAGAGRDENGADAALAFASGLTAGITELAEQVQVSVTMRVGVSTGQVALGVFGEHGLVYTAWGVPVRRALVVGGLAIGDEILLDRSAREAITAARWEVREAQDVVDIDGEPMSLWALVGAAPTS